jgi:hypothetical protein
MRMGLTAFYGLGVAFTIWMAVEAVRRGDAGRWLWIILLFGPMGSAVYFFSEYLGSFRASTLATWKPVSARELQAAEADVRRLDNSHSWAELARLKRLKKDFGQAVFSARKALEREPNLIEGQYELGHALLAQGKAREAVAPLAAVVQQKESYDTWDALFALGRAERQAGDLEAARRHLELLSERASRADFLYELGSLQVAVGDRPAAKATFQRIIDEAAYVPNYMRSKVKKWVRLSRRAMSALG